MALKFHPDRLEKADAKDGEMFQRILTAYNVLKDSAKRDVYDRTGEICSKDPFAADQFVEAYQHFRRKFPELRTRDIESFADQYRFSEEEEKDLLGFFVENKGNLTDLLEHIVLSRDSDVPRFLAFFDRALESKQHRRTLAPWKAAFARTRGKIRRLGSSEAKEAAELRDQRLASLQQAILLRGRSRNSGFLEQLERAFTDEKEEPSGDVLKDSSRAVNRGKRARPGLRKAERRRAKRKKLQRDASGE